MNTANAQLNSMNHPVVSSDRWIAERLTLLAREKELTRLRDAIARERRALERLRPGGGLDDEEAVEARGGVVLGPHERTLHHHRPHAARQRSP